MKNATTEPGGREAERHRRGRDVRDLVRPAVRDLVAYHLDRWDAPIKLDQNENTFGVPGPVREELVRRLATAPLHRYPDLAQPELRAALSERFEWPSAGILVGNGSNELLQLLGATFLEPGRAAVAPSPSFFVYSYVSRLAGASVAEVSLRDDLQYDVGAVEASVDRHRPHLLFLCSPNNPTGSVLSPSDVARLADRAPGIVALDEAYWEFAGGNALGLLREHPNLVILRTFSKALGMAGMRIGFLLAEPDLAREIEKTQQPYPLSRLSQEGALAALSHYDLLRERAAVIVDERERVHRELSRLDGVEAFASKSNFLLFRTRLGAKRTFAGLLERGILVRDVSRHPKLREALRVGVGTPDENAAFVRALEQTLKEDGA